VDNYSVAPDQTRVVLLANRGPLGAAGVFYVNPAAPGTEVQLNDPNLAGTVSASTVGLPAGAGGSSTLARVAYSVSTLFGTDTYIAEVSPTPGPRAVVSNGVVVGLRPNDSSVLFARRVSFNDEIWEKVVDAVTPEERVGGGVAGVFDSAGDTVILTQAGPSSTAILASAYRGSFGTTQQLGTAGQPARFIGLNGAPRGVALVGEGTASNATLNLVNARAPDRLIPLAGFQSPLNLSSPLAYVVTY
jgi:hypothetical protein